VANFPGLLHLTLRGLADDNSEACSSAWLTRVQSTNSFEFNPVFGQMVYSDGSIPVNAVSCTDETIGLPLHLLDASGRRIRSFGAEPPICW
jgi:hypothetical protein